MSLELLVGISREVTHGDEEIGTVSRMPSPAAVDRFHRGLYV